MKTICLILSLVFFTMFVSAQQTAPEKIIVNTTDLTPDQLAKIKAQQELETLQKKMDTYGKWVGVGGEVGTAIKEGLNAVVDVSDKFGKTDVGKFTLAMVAWKIMGKDVLRIFFGIVFAVIFTVFMFKYYKTNFTVHKIKVKDNGWKFWLPNEYQLVTPNERWDGYQFVKWLTILMLIGGYIITYAIMFG